LLLLFSKYDYNYNRSLKIWGRLGFDGFENIYSRMSRIHGHLVNHLWKKDKCRLRLRCCCL